MNWFDEQLHDREQSDNADFADALDSIADAVMGTHLREALSRDEIADSALEEILKYYHCKAKTDALPPKCRTVEEQIDYRMRPFGIKSRRVALDRGWYRHAVGAMLGTRKEDGAAVALIPGAFSGYVLVDIKSGKRIRLNRKTEQLLDREAVCFYQALPQKALTVSDLLTFLMRQLTVADITLYLLLMGASALLGLLAPKFTRWLFGDVLRSGSLQILLALAVFALCFSVSRLCFSVFQSLSNFRIQTKQGTAIQAAMMSRLMSLPPAFFRQYSSGELAQRLAYVQMLCTTLFNTIGVTGLSALFSLIYIGQIFTFAPALVLPSLAILLTSVALSLLTTFRQIGITRERVTLSAKTSGLTYATITGIQKIKLAGAEKRMFSRWARMYAAEARLAYNPPVFLKLSGTFTTALSLLGTLLLYAAAIKNHVSVADYYAFTTAYGMASAAFAAVVSVASTVADIKPTLEMVKPILEAEPEVQEKKEIVTELEGAIELSHITFRYDDTMPCVIDDLSLKVKPGEYLAIVGSTGCGKSTLMRLILGFEKPQKGSVLFDGKDLSGLDIESLRRKVGAVIQDGKLFLGDIYSNITITAPGIGMEKAWKAAEIASIADDIRAMPMGMHTMISEGQGGISGGQKQRLMIARALAPEPKILIFDEATSALDNVTQRSISDAIDALACTRIIIAHRLSTIRHADRIIYLDRGRIVEEGTYEELIAANGAFARLVERQRLDLDGTENDE